MTDSRLGMAAFGPALALAACHLAVHGPTPINLTAVVVSLPGLILSSYRKDENK